MLALFSETGTQMVSWPVSPQITHGLTRNIDGLATGIAFTQQMTNGLRDEPRGPLPPRPAFAPDIDGMGGSAFIGSERGGALDSNNSESVNNKDGNNNNDNKGNSSNDCSSIQNKEDKLHALRISRSDKQSSTNLFISNIPHCIDHADLERLFAPFGEIVSAAVMRNIHTGASLGNAFVRYATTEEAERAFVEMSGRRVNGRAINIQWAKKQHDDTPIGEARKKIFKLFVRNIPLDIGVSELSEMFACYGPVKTVSIHKDTAPSADKSSERHIAFIIYLTEGAAEKAAEAVHNTRPFPSCGRVPLMVKLAEDFPQHHHHGNGANDVGSNSTRGNKLMQHDVGRGFSAPERGGQQFGNGTAAVSLAGSCGVSNFFSPMTGADGFYLPQTVPGGMGMRLRPGQACSPGAPVVWQQRTGPPIQFFNGGVATATAELLPLNSAVPASYYQPSVSQMGGNGVAPMPMYTSQVLQLPTDLNAPQADGMVGALHFVDFSSFSTTIANGAGSSGMPNYAPFVPPPPPPAVVSVAEPVTPFVSEPRWAPERQAPLATDGVSAGCLVIQPQQNKRSMEAVNVTAPVADTFGTFLFSGGITAL